MSKLTHVTRDAIDSIAPKGRRIASGAFDLPTGGDIEVYDDGSHDYPINLKLPEDSFWSSSDLRATAKLFNRMAKTLEREGRDLT